MHMPFSVESSSSNSGEDYLAEEIDVVLQLSPTTKNVELLAKALRRGRGGIELIYRFAFGSMRRGGGSQAIRKKIAAAKKRLGIIV